MDSQENKEKQEKHDKEHRDFYTLLLSIKSTVDGLNSEDAEIGKVINVFNESMDKVYSCLNSIKLDLQKLKVEQSGFIDARRDRSLNCDKIHADFEKRLRDHPPELRCAHENRLLNLEKITANVSSNFATNTRLHAIETKVDNLIPLLYKVVGGVLVIAIIVPPIISSLISWYLKK